MQGRDVLACAHDRQRQDRRVPAADPAPADRASRAARRARSILTPTRELAAQILEDLNALAVHTPLTGAAVFGGVGMGPQEHAFRSGVDVIVATPGPAARSLPAAVREARQASSTSCSTKPIACSTWASCPTSAASCGTSRRSGRRCSSARRCRRRSARWRRDAEEPGARSTCSGRRRRRSASRRRCIPVSQELKAALLRRAAAARHPAARRSSSRARSTAPTGWPSTWCRHRRQRGADPRQPLAGAAHRGARRVQERQVSRARRDRHRGARHRRRGAQPRRQLRRARGAGGLHPPRRPHRARRADRRRVHVRGAGGGRRICARSSARSARRCRA